MFLSGYLIWLSYVQYQQFTGYLMCFPEYLTCTKINGIGATTPQGLKTNLMNSKKLSMYPIFWSPSPAAAPKWTTPRSKTKHLPLQIPNCRAQKTTPQRTGFQQASPLQIKIGRTSELLQNQVPNFCCLPWPKALRSPLEFFNLTKRTSQRNEIICDSLLESH